MPVFNPHSLEPIGVFDSGVGGLSVLRQLLRLLPQEDFVYLADTAWAPYGERSEDETVALVTETERSVEITGPVSDTLGSLWDPIPVTPTTYVSRPLLPRSVRTIDLSAPVASSELRPVIAERPAERVSDEDGLPRAVGE